MTNSWQLRLDRALDADVWYDDGVANDGARWAARTWGGQISDLIREALEDGVVFVLTPDGLTALHVDRIQQAVNEATGVAPLEGDPMNLLRSGIWAAAQQRAS